MRFGTGSPLLLSIESAANIDPAGGGGMPPEQPLERVTDDSVGSIISDYASERHEARQAVQADTVAAAQQDATQAVGQQDEAQQATEGQQAGQEAAQVAQTEQPADTVAAPESVFAPIFDLVTLPTEQAVPQAVDMMRQFYQADPLTYKLLASAVLQASPKAATEFVLRANGIPQEKVGEFQSWLARGGDKLPEPVEYPAFGQTVQKLRASDTVIEDAENQWVRLPNGLELNLANPRDKSHFELEKRLYDGDVKDKQALRADADRQRQEADSRKQAEAEAAQQDLTSRVDFYYEDRRGIVAPLLADTINNLAPEDKMRGMMLQSLVTNLLERTDPALLTMLKQTDPETAAVIDSITAIGNKLTPYVREGAGFEKTPDGKWQMVGRAKELADQQARLIRTAVNGIKDRSNKDILRTNRAELAATATAPVIPQGVKEVVSRQPESDAFDPEKDSRASIIDDYRRDMAASRR